MTRRSVALVALVAGEIVWIFDQDASPGHLWWLVVVALLGFHTWLVHAEGRDPRLDPRLVVGATVVAAFAAVVAAPFGSHDVYQYAMYGRMVTVHHANPYVVVPAAFPHDPLYPSLSAAWHHTPTVYGPLFTGVSALGALIYGTSATVAAHVFQSLDAVALVGSVVHLWRRRATTAALVFVGLSPVLLAATNGAHNDLLAGALVLIGLDQARQERFGRSAVLLAAATLIKALAAPAALAVFVVLAARRRGKSATTFVLTLGGLVGTGYLAAGGPAALKPLHGLGVRSSRASLWGSLQAVKLVPDNLRTGHPSFATLALVVTAGVMVLLVSLQARRRPTDATPLAVALMACSIFAAVYVLPWYPASLLPAAGLVMASAVRRVAQLGSAVLLVAYVFPPGVRAPRWVPAVTVGHVSGLLLGLMVVGLVVAATVGNRPRRA